VFPTLNDDGRSAIDIKLQKQNSMLATHDVQDENGRTWPANLLSVLIRQDTLLMLCVMAVAVFSELPFFYAAGGQLPQAHDFTVHWMRAVQFDETLKSGIWYPRWLGGMNYGYGAATSLFYAPFVYYATSAAHALLGGWSRAFEAVALLTAAGSGLTFFIFARDFLGARASVAAGLMYVLLPYRLIDLYHRAAFPELIAFVWMPLVLYAINRAMTRSSARNIIGGAVAYCLLIVTHPPVAYLFSIALAVFAITTSLVERRWRMISTASGVVALGAGLSAFYWIPATLEVGLVKQNVTRFFKDKKGYINDLAATTGFERLLAASAILTLLLFLLFLAQSKSEGRSRARQHRTGWMIVGFLGFVMMTPAAAPIEHFLPGISGIAFAWRWQAIEVLAVAILAGISIEALMRSHRRQSIAVLSSVSIAVFAFGIIGCAMASNLKVRFIPPADQIEEDFMPVDSPGVEQLTKGISATITPPEANGSVRLIQWQPQSRIFKVSNSTDAVLEVPTFMFPGWTAMIDGQKASPRAEFQRKTIIVDLPPGEHIVALDFSNTTTRTVAKWVSIAALILCAIVFIGSFFRKSSQPALRFS